METRSGVLASNIPEETCAVEVCIAVKQCVTGMCVTHVSITLSCLIGYSTGVGMTESETEEISRKLGHLADVKDKPS